MDENAVSDLFGVIDSGEVETPVVEPDVSSADAPREIQKEQPSGESEEKTDEQEQASEDETSETTQTQTEPSQTETQTETENKEADKADAVQEVDWQAGLPPAPPEYQGKIPEVDADGNIVNMTPQEYIEYQQQYPLYLLRKENYNNTVESAAISAAEQILPEMKTNPAIAQLVRDMRVASVISGTQINSYEAAKTVRDALGISPEKLQAAKAEGAQNAKVQIKTVKNAALETSSSQVKSDNSKDVKLDKRLRSGHDDAAFESLLDSWSEQGLIQFVY